MARTADGRAFRMLTIIDEYTRECLAILTQRRITSQEVIEQLFYLFIFRGTPQYIRSSLLVTFATRRQNIVYAGDVVRENDQKLKPQLLGVEHPE
ncbi:unnamed protein product [marine sediment metagenome]|uniref:Integrase catalytic domain-containing protein n=2 Tax=marine sediment metagenome TaxID=412755 RepID=X1TC22_9ZZZZ